MHGVHWEFDIVRRVFVDLPADGGGAEPERVPFDFADDRVFGFLTVDIVREALTHTSTVRREESFLWWVPFRVSGLFEVAGRGLPKEIRKTFFGLDWYVSVAMGENTGRNFDGAKRGIGNSSGIQEAELSDSEVMARLDEMTTDNLRAADDIRSEIED